MEIIRRTKSDSKDLRDKQFSFRTNQLERDMIQVLKNSHVDIATMLREYIKEIYEEVSKDEDMLG